jgi:hypothetical protein
MSKLCMSRWRPFLDYSFLFLCGIGIDRYIQAYGLSRREMNSILALVRNTNCGICLVVQAVRGSVMARKNRYNIPTLRWTCPHCGFVIVGSFITRLTSGALVPSAAL